MATVKILALRAPGTNCELEACYAFERAGSRPTRVHINALLERPAQLAEYQILLVPGGFSYGDDIAAGKILASQLSHHLAEPLLAFRDSGKLILGICNGFQVLVKAGLLSGGANSNGTNGSAQQLTLAYNDSGKFECRWIHLTADPGRCVFLRGIERMDLPIAHGEGKFVCRDSKVLQSLARSGQLVLRYARPGDSPRSAESAAAEPLPYPINPNGSESNIAGICDATGRVFGLMPHPERHVEVTQHPHWTRQKRSTGDGLRVFENAVQYFA